MVSQENRSVRIPKNKTKVKKKKEAQMSMSSMVLFLSEGAKLDNGENHGVLSLLCWCLSFSYLSPLHQITVINI